MNPKTIARVVDRIPSDAQQIWNAEGKSAQFHPSYTRMVPAHLVTTLRLIGCPDPNPVYRRFFDPPRGTLRDHFLGLHAPGLSG